MDPKPLSFKTRGGGWGVSHKRTGPGRPPRGPDAPNLVRHRSEQNHEHVPPALGTLLQSCPSPLGHVDTAPGSAAEPEACSKNGPVQGCISYPDKVGESVTVAPSTPDCSGGTTRGPCFYTHTHTHDQHGKTGSGKAEHDSRQVHRFISVTKRGTRRLPFWVK